MARFTVELPGFLLAGQIVLTLVVMAAAIALPHAGDPILLLPVTRQAAHDLSGRLFDGRTRLLGAGPVSGSLVIKPTDGEAWRAFITMGVLPLRYPRHWCGAGHDG